VSDGQTAQREAAESAVYDVLTDDANEGLDVFDLACKIVAALAPVQPDPLRAGIEELIRMGEGDPRGNTRDLVNRMRALLAETETP